MAFHKSAHIAMQFHGYLPEKNASDQSYYMFLFTQHEN